MITKEKLQLTVADILPPGAEDTFTWSSDNTRCATVDQSGLVSCLRPGEATITAASSRGLTRSCTIHVCFPVTSISFSREELTAFAGTPLRLIANVRMQTQTCVNRLVTFESSDPAIADVDRDGIVTPYASGSVTITATAESGISDSCTVNVISMDNAPTMTLPGGVTHIEDEAFLGTSAVIYVIPSGTGSIGSLAFADLPNAQLIRIPGSVTSIADDAFSGSSVVIQCPAGSYAETWAQDHGITVQN